MVARTDQQTTDDTRVKQSDIVKAILFNLPFLQRLSL